jgi:hypothetical protein
MKLAKNLRLPEEREKRKRQEDRRRLNADFDGCICVICGKPAMHHHYYCDKHYGLEGK